MNRIRRCTAVLIFSSAFAGPVLAVNITSVVETGGDNEATDTITAKWTGQTFNVTVANEPIPGAAVNDPYTVGLFDANAPAYVDRNHRYYDDTAGGLPIPAYLIGQEYIMSGNDNRDNATYRLNVTVAAPSTVYMLIDNRLGASPNADPPTFGPTAMQWILDQGWMATNNGMNRNQDPLLPDEVAIDEGANDSVENWFSIYKKDFSAGLVSLFQADNGGQNMYGVVIDPTGAAVLPGDTNANGTVDINDFTPIRDNFRKTVTSRAQGDLVGNGIVDFADFRQWKSAFIGMGGSLAGLDLGPFGASVPEPSAVVILLATIATVALCRIKRQARN